MLIVLIPDKENLTSVCFRIYPLSEQYSNFVYSRVTEDEYVEEWMKKVYSGPESRRQWIDIILVKYL